MRFRAELFSVINVGLGLVIAVLITHYILPFFGYPAHWVKDVAVTLIYTLASLIRNDIVYRIFHRFVK